MRRAGEAGKDQHAGVVGILSRDIFLRDQIHAVTERSDERDFRSPVEAGEQFPIIALVHIADRDPVDRGELAVYATGYFVELRANILVGVHLASRRRRDL
jgi:hypothetical protein